MATLKERLIEKIKQTEDQNTLEELYRVLDMNFDDEVYFLSDQQRAAVIEAEEQIQSGHYLSSEQADKEIDEWLQGR